MQVQRAQAEDTLPDLGRPNGRSGTFSAGPQGATLDNRFDGKRLVVSPEYSDQTGLSLGGAFAFPLGESAAGGLVATAGARKKELLFNAGFRVDEVQRLVFTLGQLRQTLDIGFISGSEKAEMTQNSGAVSYQRYLGQGLLNSFEVNGYLADTGSRDLADKTYAIDTAALYELWNDPRRVAGGRVTGLQGRLAFTPLPGSTLKLGAGGERLEYDYFTGKQSTSRATGSAEWSQQLAAGLNLKAGADAAAAQNRYTLGLEGAYSEGWKLGVNLTGIRGRDGAPDDNQLKLTWSHTFGGKGAKTSATAGSAAPAWGSLLDQVARRPSFLPAQVVAKLDTTATPTRLIAVDKTALPAGSSVNTATGVITTPLGVAVTGIAGVTKNATPFANSGQFSLSGNNLVIDPSKITQPAVGVIDTYVVTLNNAGGGTTLATVLVSHGSVKIDSISIVNGATDVTAPTTTAAPSVSGTTDTATTLSATINEAGTGYYLVQPAAAAAPTVAAVQAGTSFAMTANVAATPAISGLTASTAYKIYFVAKDAANNVQAAVSSVAVTTSAAPDITLPVTSSAPAISVAATDTTASVTQTINENGTGYYLVQAAAAAAPSVAAVMAGTSFAMTANTPAVVSLTGLTASTAYKYYFVAKDAANNPQAAVSAGLAITTTATVDVTPPAAPTGLALNSGAATTTGTSVTLDGLTTPPDADLAAWFVSESASAPAAGAAGWSSTKPTSYTFATATNETKTVCVYVKDTSNNVQATGSCDTTVKVAVNTAPTLVSVTPSSDGTLTSIGTDSYADSTGSTVTFTLVATDPEGTPVQIVVDGVVHAGSTYQYLIPDTNVPHTFVFQGSDGSLLTPTSKTITITGA